jgi:hypothetical protein
MLRMKSAPNVTAAFRTVMAMGANRRKRRTLRGSTKKRFSALAVALVWRDTDRRVDTRLRLGAVAASGWIGFLGSVSGRQKITMIRSRPP